VRKKGEKKQKIFFYHLMTRLLYRQRNMTLGDDKEEEKPVHKRKISHFE
jgi:hypothetical protein